MSAPTVADATNDRSGQEQLRELLTEVTAVAIRLRGGVGPTHAGELPPGARAVLQLLLKHGALAVPALARARGTSRQNIQTIVNRLRTAGCVSLAENPAHRRSELVRLTEAGAALLQRGAGREAETLNALLPVLTKADLSSACRVLRALRGRLERTRAPGRPAEKKRPPRTHAAVPGADNESLESALPVNLL